MMMMMMMMMIIIIIIIIIMSIMLHSMKRSPYGEVNRFLAILEIPGVL